MYYMNIIQIIGGGELNNIKILRERSGKTQEEIASAFDCDTSTISKWETGESQPRADKLPVLARLFGCTIDDLFDSVSGNEVI